MLYKTTCAISYKGDRVRAGVVLDLTEEEATNLSTDVVPMEAPAEAPEPTPEKALADMNYAELKAKAKELGLKQSGSMADLVERISLHLASAPEPTEHEVTEQDLLDHPEWVELEVQVGDIIELDAEGNIITE